LKLAQNFAVLQADARNAERERDRREYEEARREDLEAVRKEEAAQLAAKQEAEKVERIEKEAAVKAGAPDNPSATYDQIGVMRATNVSPSVVVVDDT
jgi:hypothetical protein